MANGDVQTWNLSDVLHKQDSKLLNIAGEKHISCNIFGNKLRMEDALLAYRYLDFGQIEQIVSFSTLIQSYLQCP